MNYTLYKIVRFIGKPIFTLLYRPEYIGLENIPEDGNVILAGNHTNNLDAALMISGPKRIVHILAKKELFKSKISSWFFTNMGCISVDRSKHDEVAKKKTTDILKDGKVIGIFPEGTINRTSELLLPLKYGAVSFAKKTDAYIVPFSITGKYTLFKKNIKIIYGKAYKVNKELEDENKILADKIKKLMLKEML